MTLVSERYKFNAGLYNFVYNSVDRPLIPFTDSGLTALLKFMKCRIKAFGISREIIGSKLLEMDVPDGHSISDLKKALVEKYPAFDSLKSLYIAVNNEYAAEDTLVMEGDEIALIPPVSGG